MLLKKKCFCTLCLYFTKLQQTSKSTRGFLKEEFFLYYIIRLDLKTSKSIHHLIYLPDRIQKLIPKLKGDAITAYIFFKSSGQLFFVICTRFIRLMVPTGLIGSVKPNTKAFKQNNLKSTQLLSSKGDQRGETKQNKK